MYFMPVTLIIKVLVLLTILYYSIQGNINVFLEYLLHCKLCISCQIYVHFFSSHIFYFIVLFSIHSLINFLIQISFFLTLYSQVFVFAFTEYGQIKRCVTLIL